MLRKYLGIFSVLVTSGVDLLTSAHENKTSVFNTDTNLIKNNLGIRSLDVRESEIN